MNHLTHLRHSPWGEILGDANLLRRTFLTLVSSLSITFGILPKDLFRFVVCVGHSPARGYYLLEFHVAANADRYPTGFERRKRVASLYFFRRTPVSTNYTYEIEFSAYPQVLWRNRNVLESITPRMQAWNSWWRWRVQFLLTWVAS